MSENRTIPAPIKDHANQFVIAENRSYTVTVPNFGTVHNYGYLAIIELTGKAGWNGRIMSTRTQRVVYIDGKIHMGGPAESEAREAREAWARENGIQIDA